MDISIVIPFLNEKESLPELYQWITKVMNDNQYDYEIIFIDDGSTDDSWSFIEELHGDTRVKAIQFRRNEGKSVALKAGFIHVNGAVVITMDADLQDSPDEIPELYNMITKENYDLICGWKKKRYDPINKIIPTKIFNFVARKVSGLKLHDFNCGLKAFKKSVVKDIDLYGNMHRYIPILALSCGYKNITEKVVVHQKRKYGKSKFGMDRFINGFVDLILLYFSSKFAKRPMHLFGGLGFMMFFFGFLCASFIGASKIIAMNQNKAAPLITQNSWFYISITCMIIGTQMLLSGFITEMIQKQNRPRRNILEKKTIRIYEQKNR